MLESRNPSEFFNEGDTEFSPNQAVNGISKYILQNESQDIVICGSQSGIGSSQTVPLLVAVSRYSA